MTTLTINTTLTAMGDITAPTLTSATGAKNGSSAYTGSVTTNENNGTLFHYASTNPSETKAQIAAAGLSQAVSATGAQAVSGSGLLAETSYYLHFFHRDAAGNESAVLTSNAFTTDALGAGTGTVTLTTVNQMHEMVAPASVQIRVNVSGASVSEPANLLTGLDPTHRELTYITTWDDAGASADSTVTPNLPTAHSNINISHGKYPAHVFESAGTYDVMTTVWEQDGTFVGSATTQFVVSDPNTVFTGTRTILVNAAGAGDGAYAGAQTVTTLGAAVALVNSKASTHRILLKAGEQHTVANTMTFTSAYPNVYIGRYGTGANPEIILSGSYAGLEAHNLGAVLYCTGSFGGDFVLDQVDMTGDWDVDTETGKQYMAVRFLADNSPQGLVSRCRLTDWSVGVYGGNGGAINDLSFTLYKTAIYKFGDYGMVPEGTGTVWWKYIASSIEQGAQAMQGGQGKSIPYAENRHGPVRAFTAGNQYMECCTLYSRTSWPANLISQPCFRADSLGGTAQRATFGLFRSIFVSGGTPLQLGKPNDTITLREANFVADMCRMVTGMLSWSGFSSVVGGVTVRSSIIECPNVIKWPYETSGFANNWQAAWDFRKPVNPRADSGAPVQIYNCTTQILLNDTNRATGAGGSLNGLTHLLVTGNDLPNQTFVNNIVLRPNASASGDEETLDQTALPTLGGTFGGYDLGRKHKSTGTFPTAVLTMNTAHAVPAGSSRVLTPEAGSSHIGAAAGLSAYLDYYGNVRGANPDRGAVERM